MCEDCEKAAPCSCEHCREAGYVITRDRSLESYVKGSTPWCIGCHHYIGVARSSSDMDAAEP